MRAIEFITEGVAEGSESDAYGKTGEKHECGSCDGTGIDTHDDECPECGGKGWVRDKESLKKCWPGHRKVGTQPGTGKNKGKRVNDCEKIEEQILTPDEQFDIIEEMVEQLALEHGVDPEVIWEDFDSVDDNELLESAAWRRSAGKSKKGGLNAKGVASYRRENPGSKLQMAVTTKPSKLKAGSKAAKRRKSFCARMGGVKGPMKKPNGKPTRKALALRKWNC